MPAAAAEATRRFEALVARAPGASVRKMFGQPAAFLRGQMFLGVFGDEVFLRLAPGDRTRAVAEGGHPFEPMPGRPMREYVVLPPELLDRAAAARTWVRRSIEFVSGLPPK